MRISRSLQQSRSVVDDDPATGTSTSGTSAVTNGNSTSRSGVRITSRSWAALCSMRSSSPTTSPSIVSTRRPTQLVVVELLGVLRQLVGVDGSRQLGAAGGLGGVAVGDLLEAHDQAAGVGARAAPRSAARCHCLQTLPGREAALGLVGARLHEHLALEPVGRADPADHDVVVSTLESTLSLPAEMPMGTDPEG